jgi:4-alpha-glucanotransferase
MGAPGDPTDPSGPNQSSAVVIVTPEKPFIAPADGDLVFERGGSVPLTAGSPLPGDTPFGYHQFNTNNGPTTVIVSPGTCVVPHGLKTWGWAVQLYAARSRRSWGIGDFGDLRTITDWSIARHAKMVLVNPLHAASPVISQQPSPYFPTSRVYRNPLFLAIEQIPGYGDVARALAPIAEKAKRLNSDRRIDRDEVFRAKYAALDHLWDRWKDRPAAEHAAFATYKNAEGQVLHDYATFCAYVELHPSSWFDWPENMRRPSGSGIQEFRKTKAERIDFHAWVQWLLDEQLRTAGEGLALMTDLAIGVDRGGADGWMWQDCFALGMSVGAPPDEFNTRGQDWGLPPFDPWKLREAAYEPFIRTVRSAFRHAGALRIDHVMGLFRLYWIPLGGSAKDGCYVYLPFHDLLAIVALESHRSGAYVVGEDLGTVEPYVREELSKAAILSYKLSQFEPGPAADFPERALAAVTTHDLPTIPGIWSGADLRAQTDLGLNPNIEGTNAVRSSFANRAGFSRAVDTHTPHSPGTNAQFDEPADALSPDAPSPDAISPDAPSVDAPSADDVVAGVYRELATAPCMILTATLDDALGVEERPNMPGTIDQWPNWRIALPVDLETALADPRVANVAKILSRP